MYSEEYLRDLEMSANLNRIARKQEQEIMICPVCGRKVDKWVWRTTCCGAEIVWEDTAGDKALEDIKAEIYDLAQWYMEHDMEDIAQVICLDVIAIIDKHIGGGKNADSD